MKYLDDLEKLKSKDVLHLIQLLKENLIFWSSEMSENEPNYLTYYEVPYPHHSLNSCYTIILNLHIYFY